MYKRREAGKQLEFVHFHLPFGGKLRADNRWVVKARLIPWGEIERRYSDEFSPSMGAPGIRARVALGSLLIKEMLGLSDRETVEQIRENPYLQYFLGFDRFHDEEPFDPSMFVYFRKRFPQEVLIEINKLIVEAVAKEKPQEPTSPPPQNEEREPDPDNQGKVITDASCTPADIRFPTDLSLLNEAREKTELIIDALHAPLVGKEKKPRTYREKAHRQYLGTAKKRRISSRALRKAIGQQLRYINRNLNTIKELTGKTSLTLLPKGLYQNLLVASELYRQQNELYKKRTHSIQGRIVSISEPHVRPIVRGKASAPVEFGAKISVSLDERGFAFLERLSFDPYNESLDLPMIIERYRERTGHYPESAHVDAIYRTRENRRYCKERNIRMSGPALGRPRQLSSEEKAQASRDERDRIPVEGCFGVAKRRYGLGRIRAHRADTSGCMIALTILVMNLEKIAKIFLSPFFSVISYLLRSLSNWFMCPYYQLP